MRVQRLVMPVTGVDSLTVLDDDLVMVASAERFLAQLSAIERSPNTLRAYAHSLALWWVWLGRRKRAWDAAEVEDVSKFVRWLRAPTDKRDRVGRVRVAPRGVDGEPPPGGGVRFLRLPCSSWRRVWWRGGACLAVPISRSCTTSPRDGRFRPAGQAQGAKAAAGQPDGLGGGHDPGALRPAARPVLVGVAGRDGDAGRPGAGAAARRLGVASS